MLDPAPSSPLRSVPSGRLPGVVLVLCTLLLIVAISHHPSIGRVPRAEVMAQLVRLVVVDGWVHAVAIAVEIGTFFALTAFSMRRGLTQHTVSAALILYGVAVGGTIVAASIDGFLVPAIAERYARAAPPVMENALLVLGLCATTIQIATKLALVAAALAVLLWSLPLLRLTLAPRVAGVVGLVSAPAVAVVVLATHALNAHDLGVIVLMQSLWYLCIGALMIRDEL